MRMARERLDKVLAARGIGSRKEVGAQIRAGSVTVNGNPCRDPASKVDPECDAICVGGVPLRARKERYFMLNKPAGVLSATQDAEQQTVLDLFPACERKGLAPVGRLDKDTEGLLLLTDDGALNHALTAPRRHVAKRYRALISGTLADDAPQRFAQGVVLADGTVCRPAELQIGSRQPDGQTEVFVILWEGKYHQVKRMVAAVGGRVEYLERLEMGPLVLDDALERGQYRALQEAEIQALFQAVSR
nr:pseudouridine synthase [uncultured Butyricicoccus sp.]